MVACQLAGIEFRWGTPQSKLPSELGAVAVARPVSWTSLSSGPWIEERPSPRMMLELMAASLGLSVDGYLSVLPVERRELFRARWGV